MQGPWGHFLSSKESDHQQIRDLAWVIRDGRRIEQGLGDPGDCCFGKAVRGGLPEELAPEQKLTEGSESELNQI